MPAAANVVLADALATPVNHTFIPLGKDVNNVFWYEDQSRTSPIVYWKISMELKRPLPGAVGQSSSSDRVSRVKISLHEPQPETLGTNDAGLTPPATVAYINRANVEFILSERSSLQDRKDIRKMVVSLLADAAVLAQVETLQSVY